MTLPFYIYNTLAREKQEFIPKNPEHVTFYLCGPTVYDTPHLGNARSAVMFDVLYRVLKWRYHKVTFMRNFTDIDDKIIKAARENGEEISALTERTSQYYLDDMTALNVLLPDVMPKATEHVPEMIDLIQKLIERGHAYEAEGHVLFDVNSMKDYGKLSRQNREGMIEGARVEVAPYKKDAADFVLWKPSTDDQPGWDSPWGRGRPGWHIECSAMIHKHAGFPVDIHAGGHDLVFPHHENEIAQGECAYGQEYARYWMHNGMLIVDGEKMSKSLGNFLLVRDVLPEVKGEVIRFYMMGTHYRQPYDFHRDKLREQKDMLDRFYLALRHTKEIRIDENMEVPEEVQKALFDDLNTPLVVTHLHEYLHGLNKAENESEKRVYKTKLVRSAQFLGVLQQDPVAWFEEGFGAGPDSAEITSMLEKRTEARASKNYAEADKIRDWFKENNIEIEDGATGTTWRRK